MSRFTAATILAGAALASAAHDAPTRIQARATSICGQWDTVETGVYTVYQDLWNEAEGTGSQCTTVDSVTDDDVLTWSTEWTWADNSDQVKSFANTVTNFTITTLSEISSIPSKWSWTYTGTDIVADVAYDLFTSSSATGSDEYEIMIWLDALGGAGPISSTGSAVATPEIADSTWSLYDGYNGDTHVFSFVATTAISDFDGDLYDFLSYLVDNEGMADTQYLLSIGAGSEPFTGSDAVFSVASYSCGVSTGAVAVATSSAAAASSSSSSSSSAAAVVTTSSTSAVATTSAEATPTTTAKAAATTSSSSVVKSKPTSSAAAASHGSGSHSQGSKSSQAVTTAAPATTEAPSSAAQAVTTLATSTKKTCKRNAQ